MNLTFLHLTLVHIPILFVPVGVLILFLAVRKQDRTLKSVALSLFVVSSIFVVPAFLLGEEAEDSVKPIPAVDKHDIHEHEEAADFALWFTVGLGLLSLGQVAVDKYKPEKSKKLTIPLFVVGLFSATTLAKTAWEGGKIRHPEAHSEKVPETPTVNSSSESNKIKIGWIGPLTGPAAALGVDTIPALKIAFDEVNKKGELPNQIELVAEDDQYQTAKSVTAYKHLVKDQKINVIIMVTYGGLFALAEEAKRDGVLLIDPLDCDDKIAALPENVICIAKKTEDLGYINGEYAIKKGLMPAAFIYFEGDPFMGTFAKASEEKIKALGGSVVYSEGYQEGTSDFRSMLLKIKSLNPRSIFFYGYDEMGVAMKQARTMGIDTQFIATNTITSPGFKSSAGESAEGSYVGSWLAPRDERLRGFLDEFEERVGRKPYLEISTIPSYDIGEILLSTLGTTGTTSSAASMMKTKLYSLKDYKGLSGTISVDPDGIVRTLKNYMFVYKNGELERLPD